jgi:multidrug efflux pump subunit AcrA (membrane-fusion protein)
MRSIARPALSLLASLAVCVQGCAAHKAAQPPPPPVVQTAIASLGPINPNEELAGVIAPYQNVAIQSTLTEPADAVYVQEGDTVRAGQLLARLDTADLQANLAADVATAQSNKANTDRSIYSGQLSISQGGDQVKSAAASVLQARANLQRDQTDLGRYAALVKQGYITEQQYQTQIITVRNDQQAVEQAQAALRSAQSNVVANGTLSGNGLQAATVEQSRATEQVALAQAQEIRVQIEKAAIRSPIDGVVVNRNLNLGEYPGSRQIFTLQQVDPVYAVLRGSGVQTADITNGAPVSITAGTGAKRTGTVVGVLNQIAPGSTDFQVKVLLKNPGGALRPGTAVLGNVTLPRREGVRVPTTAFTDDNHDTVLVVRPDMTVVNQHVTEVANDGPQTIVAGLPAGSRVITDGLTSVGNGQKVAVK